MWDYSENLMDHFKNPRNVGKLPDANGVGQVGSLACGDALKLMIKVNDSEQIEDARFQTFGCASAIASASALTEMIKGMPLNEAARITNQDIAESLDGLPKEKMHCSVMGREALESAIYNYRTGKTYKKELDGVVVCHCFGVTDKEIRRVVSENNLATIAEVTDYCKAGGACQKCHDDIEEIIRSVQHKPKPQVKSPSSSLTNLKKIHLIEDTIDREIRPVLKRDGGDLKLVDVRGDNVLVSFCGACAGCRISQITLKDVVQNKLREQVSESLIVEEASS